MDRKFVFCGCQYPSKAEKASGWEWDIPTPNRRKRRPISWSQPSLPQQRTEMEFNKRYSDNIYEAVNPMDVYSSGLIGGDPETSSLDRHPFYIPPELDIVSSEGLDGLDQPDPHDFGMDGDKEWNLYDIDKEKSQAPPPKGLFIAGIRTSAPKVGEKSSMRPLKQERPVTPDSTPKETTVDEPNPLEIAAEEEEMAFEEVQAPENLEESKSDKPDKTKVDVKTRFGKISSAVGPKLRKLASFKILGKKGGKENVAPEREEFEDIDVNEEPVAGPSSGNFQVRQVKIRFDDTLDLSLQDPSAAASKTAGIEPTEPKNAGIEVEDKSMEVDEKSKEEEKLELERLKAEEKATQDRIREEAKRLKLEKQQKDREAEAEAKRIKQEEKEAKEKEKAEQKRLKAEEKMTKQKQEAELKKQQAELKKQEAELKRQEAEAKKQEQEELKRQEAEAKKQEQEELKRRKTEADEAAKFEKERQKQLAEEAAKMAKEFQRQTEQAEDLQKQNEEDEERKWEEERKIEREDAGRLKISTEREFLSEPPKHIEYEEVIVTQKEQKASPVQQKPKKEKPKRSKFGILKTSPPPPRTEDREADELELAIMESILKNEEEGQQKSPEKSKSPTKVEILKRKLGDISFKKRFKRQSKTPPQRPSPPRFKITPLGEQELAYQYRQEMIERMDSHSSPTQTHKARLPDPQIYVTQASVETESEVTHVQWVPTSSEHAQDETEEEEQMKKEKKPIGQKLKGFGQSSRSMAHRTSQRVKSKVNVIGTDLKKFGGRMSVKYQEALKDIRAREEARRSAQEEKERRSESQSESVPTTPAGNVFRFKRKPKKLQDEENVEVPSTSKPVIVAAQRKTREQTDPHQYENSEFETTEPANGNVDRHVLLGQAHRDYWESTEKSDSREASEDRNFSGPAHSSGWESPLDSSNASSSRGQSRSRGQVGVLEEIDSDEFFLREKGLSEGEDEAEMTRFLVSELREAFRPTHVNALSSFTPPSRPRRGNKKSPLAPRRNVDSPKNTMSPNFQTFPPERPKRKQRPGYISAYVESLDNEISENEEEAENREPLFAFETNSESEDDEGIRRVKAQLKKIEDDEQYEPVNRSGNGKPSRPNRKKKQPKRKSPPQTLYYNTIAANEWADDDDLEIQILAAKFKQAKNTTKEIEMPVRPKRNSRKSLQGSKDSLAAKQKTEPAKIVEALPKESVPVKIVSETEAEHPIKPPRAASLEKLQSHAPNQPRSENIEPEQTDTLLEQIESERRAELARYFEDEGLAFADEIDDKQDTIIQIQQNLVLAESESLLFEDFQDDDLDGDGYAVVESTVPPATVPRRKRKGQSKGSNNLKRKSRELPSHGPIPSCSLPRFTPRTFHIVPPSRPHRTYSAIRPKRPPRKKVKGQQPPAESTPQHKEPEREAEKVGQRPSASIMRDRPLPPPPRPPRPAIFTTMNDLDMEAVERSLGASHYANLVNSDGINEPMVQRRPVVEELCTARNISLLGHEEEANVGCQTDPLTEEEFEDNELGSSFEEEERFQKILDSIHKLPSDEKLEIVKEESIDTAKLPKSDQIENLSASPELIDSFSAPAEPIDDVSAPTQPIDEFSASPTDLIEDFSAPAELINNFPAPNLERRISNHAAPPTQIIFPTRLHLDELEVDFLRVNELSAQTLTMDHLHTSHLDVEGINCPGSMSIGSLRVDTSRLPGVNQESLISSSERLNSGLTPFPSEPPPSFYQLSSPRSESELDPPLEPPILSPRQQSMTSASSGECERSMTSETAEDEVIDLGMRLGRSILRSGMRAISNVMESLEHILPPDGDSEDKQRMHLQLMLCVLLLLITGILLLTRTTTTQQHWDFYLPPNDLM